MNWLPSRMAFAFLALALAGALPALAQGLGGGISNPRPLTASAVTGALGYTPARSGANFDITELNGLAAPLPPVALPAPTASTLGGVRSIVAVPSRFLTSITTAGQPVLAQPAAADITGLAPSATTDTTDAANIASGSLSLLRLAPIADQRLLANLSGGPAAPAATTLGALLDNVLGSAQGSVLFRGASGWGLLAPGTSGQYLQTQGATADVQWASPSGSGTVSPGTANQLAWYAGSGDAVSGTTALPSGTTATTPAANDNSTKVATSAYSDRAASLPGFIHGLKLSTAGSSTTFGVAAGSATDSAAVSRMILGAAYTKTTSAWAVGSGNGCLDAGLIANSTWYHVFLIQTTALTTVDLLCSLSATAPTMPATYTLLRRIGSMRTNGSAQWIAFYQLGDSFYLGETLDLSIGGGSAMTLRTLSVPTGVIVSPLFSIVAIGGGGAATNVNVAPAANSALYWTAASSYEGGGGQYVASFGVGPPTNTSAQIYIQVPSFAGASSFYTHGWIDRRGQDE